jgi:hypothetical protein
VKTDEGGAYIRVWSGRGNRRLVWRKEEDRKPEHRRKWLRSIIKPQDVISRSVCVNNNDDLFLEEVIDTVGYTRMDVTFERGGIIPKSDSKGQEEIRHYAISLAQKFVRLYRLVGNQVDVRVPNETDSPIVEVRAGSEYFFTPEEIDAKLSTINRLFQWTLPQTTGVIKRDLSEEKILELGDSLRRGSEPSMYYQLLLEAKELSIVQGDHRLSVIISQSAFETFVQARLNDECKFRGLKTLISSRGNEAECEDAILDGDLRKELLGQYGQSLAGRSVKICHEHNLWFKEAYLVRNEIIHRGRRDITDKNARAAFEAVQAYAEYLDKAISNGRGSIV